MSGSDVVGTNMTNGTHGGGHCDSGCPYDWCMPLGIIIHVVGSIGINIGQNLQALGLSTLPQGVKPHKSKVWVIGMALFIVASIITFSALSLASASILVPLESVQFVVNLLFGKFVRNKVITMRMYFGTSVLIGGITIIVIFGPKEGGCYDLAELRGLWANTIWIVYFLATFAVAAVAYVAWRFYNKAKRAGTPYRYSSILEPLAFTVSSSLFGGGQMIVHSKLLAELIELTAASGEIAFADGFFWLEVLLTVIFGVYWLFRLSQCLGLYDPLFIIPLMQTGFIVFGAIAGGIFYKEFDELTHNPICGICAYPLYILGILTTIFGLAFLSPPGSEDDAAKATGTGDVAVEMAAAPAGAGRVGDPTRGPRRRSLKHAVTMPIAKLMPNTGGDDATGWRKWFGMSSSKGTSTQAKPVDVTSAAADGASNGHSNGVATASAS